MLINDILKNPWDIFNDFDEEIKQEFELSNMLVDIACKIINYRLDNDMTQRDLANKLEITQAMVSKLESGEYNPSIEFLFKISKKLDWKFELTFEENHSDVSIEYNIEKEQQILNEANKKTSEELESLKGLAA
ncbi:helix-turn-helix transcriptional regulator [Tissierella praeacuta]|uniref:helix-turn-helix transcriptional regulator n=1 Tax=Tissierella praeacuta TaxID=43131 RepID=UPI001C10B5E5|nr:helix-turn-helix transcriptional regulator [Tissierella praeacuta]MBU5256308.1 helix-turn-helix domain-containing protein [Tissierella praeacuta]